MALDLIFITLLSTVFWNSGTCFLFNQEIPEVHMDVKEIVEYRGYPCEKHRVITKDGYVLEAQRIPHGLFNKYESIVRPPIFLQHGLLDSAHTWINNLPEKSLAFILADRGFDVWMGNSRGSTYSRRHTYMSINSKKYWEFSFDEMAKYDLPAFIEYVLKVSGHKKLSYVGHSQGTAMAFGQFSADQALASKIASFTALGPVTTVGQMSWIPYFAIETISKLSPALNLISYGEFMPSNELLKLISATVCAKDILLNVCRNPIFWIAGFDVENLNKTRLPVIVAHTPAGTSLQNMIHYDQMAKSKKFAKFDHGSASINLYKYGSVKPPEYNVTNLKVPLAMFWGGKDTLADPEDVKDLFPKIYTTLKHEKFIPYYNHMDYIWGNDAHRVIYEDLIRFVRSELE